MSSHPHTGGGVSSYNSSLIVHNCNFIAYVGSSGGRILGQASSTLEATVSEEWEEIFHHPIIEPKDDGHESG